MMAAELMPDLAGLQSLWLRGGFPLSWLAPDDEASFSWRQDFIRTFLQRDLAVAKGVRAGRGAADAGRALAAALDAPRSPCGRPARLGPRSRDRGYPPRTA